MTAMVILPLAASHTGCMSACCLAAAACCVFCARSPLMLPLWELCVLLKLLRPCESPDNGCAFGRAPADVLVGDCWQRHGRVEGFDST